jgi:hypothetical protein
MSTLTPAGTGCAENGFPIDHRTGVIAIMGSMLKFPVAVNCTMPLEFFASAEAGDTVMLCNWRADIVIMELPPQETTISSTDVIARKSDALRMNNLRIDTSKSTAEKGKRSRNLMVRQ